VPSVRTAHALTRAICGGLFAMMLALRVLAPAGFMPAFDHRAVTILLCPDTDPAPAMTAHDHGHSKKLHQPCPYASASGLGAIAADLAPLVDFVILAAALLLGRTFLFIERNRAHERPYLRGPPLPV
jgi:hypothetical protein